MALKFPTALLVLLKYSIFVISIVCKLLKNMLLIFSQGCLNCIYFFLFFHGLDFKELRSEG